MSVLHISEVFSVVGSISGDQTEEGFVIRFDAIDYEGDVWLVPEWLEAQDGTHRMPMRIVCLRPPMLSAAESPDPRYTIDAPIPKSVLNGSSHADYNVIERPNIQVRLRKN